MLQGVARARGLGGGGEGVEVGGGGGAGDDDVCKGSACCVGFEGERGS